MLDESKETRSDEINVKFLKQQIFQIKIYF